MPMSTLLAKAFEEASQLPEEEQDAVAELVISFIHPDEADEAEWDALVVRSRNVSLIKWWSNSERRKKKKVSFHFLATSEVKSHPPVLEALR